MAELGYKPNAIVGAGRRLLGEGVVRRRRRQAQRRDHPGQLFARSRASADGRQINAMFKEKSGKDLNDNTSRDSWVRLFWRTPSIAPVDDGDKIREALVATDIRARDHHALGARQVSTRWARTTTPTRCCCNMSAASSHHLPAAGGRCRSHLAG